MLQIYVSPVEKEQERGRRGQIVYSSCESIDSQQNLLNNGKSNVIRTPSFNTSSGCPTTSSESEVSRSPNYRNLMSSSEISECSATVTVRWATLVPDKFSRVDIGEFYSPERFYVLQYNGLERLLFLLIFNIFSSNF